VAGDEQQGRDAANLMGVLILRVWREPHASPGAPGVIRARLTRQSDADDGEIDVVVAGGIDDILAQTRAWLEGFATAPPPL
jgi:hypothetical protein